MSTAAAFTPASTPTDRTPVFDPARAVVDDPDYIPVYGDQFWTLSALDGNPTRQSTRIDWSNFPAALREQFRLAAWGIINLPIPAELLSTRIGTMRGRLGIRAVVSLVGRWRRFAAWLDTQSITSLDQVTGEVQSEYVNYLHRETPSGPDTIRHHLTGLTRLHLHALAYLPGHCRIAEPPWSGLGHRAFLQQPLAAGENRTEPIHPDTMAPLLTWALRFVEEFADDILTARAEFNRLRERAKQPRTPRDRQVLERYLEESVTAGRSIPVNRHGRWPGTACVYIAGTLDIAAEVVYQTVVRPRWRQYISDHPGPSPLNIPIAGSIEGEPWIEMIEFDEIQPLVRHLGTACYIVLAFLTGMRPGEVLVLEAGCCRVDEAAGPSQPKRVSITGRHFKDARDSEGNHLATGEVRNTPWVTVHQAAQAIEVLERLVDTGLLFAVDHHDFERSNRPPGRALSPGVINQRISDFIAWANKQNATKQPGTGHIPADPAGPVTTARFRRTLAWHIARQPDGLIALAVQYGHLRTVVSEGYASRSRGGIHELLDFETARSVADYLSDLGSQLDAGTGVSGPAAQRLIQAVAQQGEQFGGIITTERQARALLSDPLLNVFENKKAYLTCNYDPHKALCHPERAAKRTAPSLDRCAKGCANAARTDEHARQLRTEAQRLKTEAASMLTPQPIADRLAVRAEHLHSLAEVHDAERIVTAPRRPQ
ncbi:hypothetical protein [Glycomyces sp. MUSA5-2]|uniref:hypothetical protein n=1 Tax=Glycomyces sp. MUSA5-2 TaxID=2053002 RepID=UPI003008154B